MLELISSCKRKSNGKYGRMGRLLQAATTNNLSGKREESTENWFLFSSHSHTDTIQRIYDLTE